MGPCRTYLGRLARTGRFLVRRLVEFAANASVLVGTACLIWSLLGSDGFSWRGRVQIGVANLSGGPIRIERFDGISREGHVHTRIPSGRGVTRTAPVLAPGVVVAPGQRWFTCSDALPGGRVAVTWSDLTSGAVHRFATPLPVPSGEIDAVLAVVVGTPPVGGAAGVQTAEARGRFPGMPPPEPRTGCALRFHERFGFID